MIQRILELLIIIDPLGAVPLYLAMATKFNETDMKKISAQVAIALAVGGMLCTVAGAALLKFFGISLYTFNMVGGFVLFLVGFNLMQLTPSKFKTEDNYAINTTSPWLMPITFPMLLGPASISALISVEPGIKSFANNAIAMIIVGISTVIILRGSLVMYQRLSKDTMHVIMSVAERCIGLLVCAMGVQMFINAVITTVYFTNKAV